MPRFSVIIPTLNEERNIENAVNSVRRSCDQSRCEIIVADGGSSDNTRNHSSRLRTKVVSCPRGRAAQMNAGAKHAKGDILLFLHADSILPPDFQNLVEAALTKTTGNCRNNNIKNRSNGITNNNINSRQWGCFRSIDIQGNPIRQWLLKHTVAFRTLVFNLPYGDQCIFITNHTFKQIGGFSDNLPLLEDIDMVERLKRSVGRPAIVACDLPTSERRWEKLGLIRTTLINQGILLGRKLGIAPETLAHWYYKT